MPPALSRKAYVPSGGPWPRSAFRNCCLSGSETSVRFALQRETGSPHLNHQAKKATLSFYRVIGIFLPIFMLALRQHCSAVEKPRRLCCILASWADMG